MFVLLIIGMFAAMFVWFFFQALVARMFGADRGETLWTFLSWLTCTAVSIPIVLVCIFVLGGDISALGESVAFNIIFSLLYAVLAVFVFSKCVLLSYRNSFLAIVTSYAPFVIMGMIFASVMGSQVTGGEDIDDLADIAEDICDHGNSKKAIKYVRNYALASGQYIVFSDDPDAVEKVEALDTEIKECSGATFARDETKKRRAAQSVASRKSKNSDSVAARPASKTISSAEAAARIRARQGTNVAAAAPAEEVKPEVVAVAVVESEPMQELTGFHVFELADVKKHIGATVRVTRKKSDDMIGKLIAYENGSLKIEQRKYGGMVAFPVSRKDIEKLEAYY